MLAQLLCALPKACADTLFDLDQVKCSWICFFARNSEGCQARILVLGLPEQSSLMLSTGREHHLGLLFLSPKTHLSFSKRSFSSLCYTSTRIGNFLIPLNLAVFLACRVNKRSSQLFGSLGNSAVQENQTKHLNALKLVRQQSDF